MTASAQADDWLVQLPDAVDATAGEPATVSLTLEPAAGVTISRDGPIRVEVASATLTLPRHRYERRQAADPDAVAPRFDLRFTAPVAGDHELAIELRFWLCRKKTCRPVKVARTVVVHAAAPAAPAAP